jgi:hypothetical protein
VSRTVRVGQWVGLGLFAFTALLPVFHFRAYPLEGLSVPAGGVFFQVDGASAGVGFHAAGEREVPTQELGAALMEAVRGPGRVAPFWERRRWYPYFLLPLWILALVLAQRVPRLRRTVGLSLWVLALGLAGFEAAYLRAEYAPFLTGLGGRIEGVSVWLFVLAVLFYRRPRDRRPGAVEATVASQALLGFAHALTLPSTMARGWWGAFETDAVLAAVGQNFPPAFWLGCAGLLLTALPVYLRPGRGRESAITAATHPG